VKKIVVLAALALQSIACGGGSKPPQFMSIATGGTGGVYYPYGGALARLISESMPGVQATAEVTGASVDNLKLLQQGRVDLAFTLADTLADATAGKGAFQTIGAVDAKVLAVLYTNFSHVVARAGSGITKIADLRGKVVSTGSPGSGTELVADRLLMAAGLDPRKDITRHSLGASESAGALKDGKVDAFVWSGGVPTPAIQDLAATPGLSIVLLPQAELLPAMQKQFGSLYSAAVIPSTAYRGMSADVPVVGVTNVLVASSRMTDAMAESIVRLMFEKRAALEAAHPEARHLAPPTAAGSLPAPLHPGAAAFYKK
jgi:TRAP transporter TAXI family solute receptor